MTSKLANTLIAATIPTGEAGDALWRNANLEKLDFVGVIPSDKLVEELLLFKSGGMSGTALAKLLPVRRFVEKMVTSESSTIRLGVVTNPLVNMTELAVLSNDTDSDVAGTARTELAKRNDLQTKAIGGDIDAAVAILDGCLIECIDLLFEQNSAILTTAYTKTDTIRLMHRLLALAPQTRERISYTLFCDPLRPIDTPLALWALEGSLAGEAALELGTADKVSRTMLRRRCTTRALEVLVKAEHLDATVARPIQQGRADLDSMSMILELHEVAALYFATYAPVSVNLANRIFDGAPVTLLVRFMLGQTTRHPETGDISRLLTNANPQRRLAFAEGIETSMKAFTADGNDDGAGDAFADLPWVGELVLGFRKTQVLKLNPWVAGQIFKTIDATLKGDALSWEYLLGMSEEWEATLIDLIASATFMGEPVVTV